MGNCYSNNQLTIDIENDYHMVPFQQERYEYGILYTNINTKEYIIAIQIRQNEIFAKQMEYLQIVQQIIHPNILRIYGFESFNQFGQNTENCFSVENTCIYLEYYLDSLQSEINNRIENNTNFKESEIWNVIDQVVKGCCVLQSKNLNHGNITPENIFINKAGVIKLNHIVLESPKTYKFKENNLNDEYNDIFSLCLTIIYMITLTDPIQFYINNQFDIVQINESLKIIENDYSIFLIHFINLMIKQNRPNMKKIFLILPAYKEKQISLSQNEVQLCIIDSRKNRINYINFISKR